MRNHKKQSAPSKVRDASDWFRAALYWEQRGEPAKAEEALSLAVTAERWGQQARSERPPAHAS